MIITGADPEFGWGMGGRCTFAEKLKSKKEEKKAAMQLVAVLYQIYITDTKYMMLIYS